MVKALYKKIIQHDPTSLTTLCVFYLLMALKYRRNCKSFLPLDINEIRKKKQTETLFILGSGASVNNLTKKNFETIKEGFSIGVNMWVIHSFLPDAYSFEYVESNPKKLKVIEEKLSILSESNSNAPMLFVKDSSIDVDGNLQFDIPTSFKKNIRLYSTIRIPAWDKVSLSKFYRTFFNKKWILKGILPEKRASIERMTYLGILSGFKNIVYIGVDLNNTDYFWIDNPQYLNKFEVDSVNPDQKNKVHKTDIKTTNLPVSNLIKILNNNTETKFWVADKSSKLAEFLPIYPKFK